MWWWAYFCVRATVMLTKWVSAWISRWPTVAADSLGGPFWGLGGTGLWTRDLCCLFTFSWFRSPWHTTVLLCQHPAFHYGSIHSSVLRVRVSTQWVVTDTLTGQRLLDFFRIWTCRFLFLDSDLILWHKLDSWDSVWIPSNILHFLSPCTSISNTEYTKETVFSFSYSRHCASASPVWREHTQKLNC